MKRPSARYQRKPMQGPLARRSPIARLKRALPTLPEHCDSHEQAVGAYLRQLRVDAELSQSQMAALVGSHRPIVARVEAGRHMPEPETLARYARALGLTLDTVTACLDGRWLNEGVLAHLWARRSA